MQRHGRAAVSACGCLGPERWSRGQCVGDLAKQIRSLGDREAVIGSDPGSGTLDDGCRDDGLHARRDQPTRQRVSASAVSRRGLEVPAQLDHLGVVSLMLSY